MGTTYRVKGGTYHDLEGRAYPCGSTLETDEDLCAKFPNSFEPVFVVTAPADPTSAPEPIKGDEATDGDDAPLEGHVDVTDKFPLAGKNDLRVTRDKTGWWVHDADEIQNESPLKQKDVTPYIKEYLGEK